MSEERRRVAEKWLERARTDLRVAVMLYDVGEEPWVIVFHAQQAVEKALKAYLVLRGKHFGKTHNIARLIDLCAEVDPDFNRLYELGVDELYPIALGARYPDAGIEITRDEAEDAIRKAEAALRFVEEKIRGVEPGMVGTE